jgi:hypothetical protein
MRKSKDTVVIGHAQAMLMNDRVTDAVALTAISSWWWLPDFANLSQIAASLTPIFGLLWLAMQIFNKAFEWHAKYMEWRIKRTQAKHVKEEIKRRDELSDAINRAEVARLRRETLGDEGDTWP